MREWLQQWATRPTIALSLLSAGLLAIYTELLLPGAVLPGTLGGIALALGWYGLSQWAWNPYAVLAALVGICLLLTEARFPAHGLLGLSGYVLVTLAAARLLDPPQPRVPALLAAVLLAPPAFATVALLKIALRARHNKTLY